MAIPTFSETDPVAPLQNLLNTLGSAVSADIADVQDQVDDIDAATADTGWLPVVGTNANGFTPRSANPPVYRKVGPVVYLKGEFIRATSPGSSAALTARAGALPTGFRPSGNVPVTTIGFWELVIEVASNGDLRVASNTARPSQDSIGYPINGISFIAEG